jgi:hypothetical protein
MASFGFSMSMLLKREWTTFKRDRMKFGAMILNTVMKFLLVGILFMDVVPSREAINADPVNMFRGIQSIAFLYVPATVMPSLNTVALTSIFLFMQFHWKENSFTSKPIPKNTQLCLTT